MYKIVLKIHILYYLDNFYWVNEFMKIMMLFKIICKI